MDDGATGQTGAPPRAPEEPASWSVPRRSDTRSTSAFSPPTPSAGRIPDHSAPQPAPSNHPTPTGSTGPTPQEPFTGWTNPGAPGVQPVPRPVRHRATAPLYLVAVVGVSAFILGCLFGWGITSITTHFRGAVATAAASHALENAYDSCSSPQGITVGDNGRSMKIDTQGTKDATGTSMADAACVLGALEVPDYILTQIDSTRALDGTQSATWNGLSATWNYHPDSGMTMAIHVSEASGSNS